MNTRRTLATAIVICVAAAVFLLQLQHGMIDFEVYRTAGARALAGEPLYRAADEHFQFKYFPAFAFLFVPFAMLPLVAAKALWFALSVAALAGLLALSVRLLPRRILPGHILVIAAIVALGKFYGRELGLGQANLVFGFLVMWGLARLQHPPSRLWRFGEAGPPSRLWRFGEASSEAVAGILIGAAAVVKPYAVIFLPYLVATRRLRAAGAFAAVLVVILLLPAVRYGIGGNSDLLSSWWQTVSSTTPANLTNQDNVSIGGMYAKWLGSSPAATRLTMATSAGLIGFGALVVALRRARLKSDYLEVALLLTAIPLLSPQGWDYVLLLSTPAVVLIVNALPRCGRAVQITALSALAVTGLSLYDLMGRAAYTQFMAWSILTPIYGVLIAILVYVRVKEIG